jgi:hypothetical protein
MGWESCRKIASKREPALAAAKLQLDENSIAGAKAQYFYSVSSARLKSCPVTKPSRTSYFCKLMNSCLQ